MLVLQDGSGEDLGKYVQNDPQIRFIRYPGERSIGSKRNLCCELAAGDVIAHWDDDDWSFPGRIREQLLVLQGNFVTGYRSIHFYDERTSEAHEYRGSPNYAVGTSLCYWKHYWKTHPFREFMCGEDNDFVSRARGVLSAQEGVGKMVALTHGGGTSPRTMSSKQWRQVNPCDLPWQPKTK